MKAEQTVTKLRIFQSAMENASDALMLVTKDRKQGLGSGISVWYVNKAFTKLTGYDPADILGKNPVVLHGPDTSADDVRRLFESVRDTNSASGEILYYRKDGSTYWAETKMVAVENHQDSLRYGVGVYRDTTERKKLEHTLRSAKEAAEAGMRSKSEFLSTMSHEIRTPLNGILGLSELLGSSGLTQEQRELNDGLVLSARTLLRIVNDVLDFSRLEAGRVAVAHLPFSTKHWLGETLRLAESRAHAKGLSFHVEKGFVPPVLKGDPEKLSRIVWNLLDNAVKFTEIGRVTFRMCSVASSGSLCRIRFEVHDTGIGIDARDLPRLFEPFRQADGSSTRRFRGAGLGLALVQKLVDLMNGEILVESEDTKGSKFTVEVDLETAPFATPIGPKAQQDSAEHVLTAA